MFITIFTNLSSSFSCFFCRKLSEVNEALEEFRIEANNKLASGEETFTITKTFLLTKIQFN
jgi:hypothetical protein